MKELHLRFLFHMRDWLTRHLVVMHCQAMSRSFARLGDDPDLEIYNRYMLKQRLFKQKDAQHALKKRRVEPPKQLTLPRQKVRVRILQLQ